MHLSLMSLAGIPTCHMSIISAPQAALLLAKMEPENQPFRAPKLDLQEYDIWLTLELWGKA